MRRRLPAVVVCLAVLATACGTARPTESASGAAIRYIDVDARTNRFNASFLAYFPEEATVRPGDEVVFRALYNGEPHSVTMGTLAETFLDDPSAKNPKIPMWTLGESDFLPANVGRPCFLDKGAPPGIPTQSCPPVEQPAFNGKQAFYSSGFLPETRSDAEGQEVGAEFRVPIADDIEPGAYRFFCVFHGPQMSGTINVVEPGSEIQPQSAVDAAAKEKHSALVESTVPVLHEFDEPFDDTRAGEFPWPALAQFDTNDGLVKVLEFVPFTLKAKVNEQVRWSLFGTHTIAFGAPPNAKPPSVRILSTGETELKADAVNERLSPDPPAGAPDEPVLLEAPPYDSGFLSSGMLNSPERGRVEYAMRFTDPGSYRYECLLHPGMTGLVIVSV